MSEIVLQNSDAVVKPKKKVDTKIMLRNKNDLKFLIDVLIMAMFNVMLIVWYPVVEIPITVGLMAVSVVMHLHIKKFKFNNDLE